MYADRPNSLLRALAAALLVTCTCSRVFATESSAAVQPDAGQPSVHAIWLAQNVWFKFRSDQTAYTCPMFKEKVRDILLEVGVHESMIVHLKCDSVAPTQQPMNRGRNRLRWTGEVEATPAAPTYLSGTSSHITARLAFAAPVVANEESIRHATTFDAEQQLVASMHKEELPTPSTIPVFSAVWTPIQLKSKGDFRLEANDCDLLRQLSQQVFPAIGVKVTRKVNCSVAKISKPSLGVEVLMPTQPLP